MIPKDKKIVVAMSGGVDSSLTAALLARQGYDVTGVYIKTWQPAWLACDWKDERRDAMRVAAALDISFLTFDFEKEYKQKVADYMIEDFTRWQDGKELKYAVNPRELATRA